jgi:hypothetical protein
LVQLHEENPRKTFELIKVADLSGEIEKLFELRKGSFMKVEEVKEEAKEEVNV